MSPEAAAHHVTCPQRIRADLRQANNRAREQTPERRKAVEDWCHGKLCTCGCGQPANCAHHPTDDLYGDLWADLRECEPYNSCCHKMHHRGFVRCPVCYGWMLKGREKCSKCEGWRSRNVRRGKIKHPCRFNAGRQKCIPKGVCPHSGKDAEANCRTFKVREPVSA